MFRRSREAIRRAAGRVLHSIRRVLFGPMIFSVDCMPTSRLFYLRFEIVPTLLSVSAVSPEPRIHSAEASCNVRGVDIGVIPEIVVEKPLTSIEAKLVEFGCSWPSTLVSNVRIIQQTTRVLSTEAGIAKTIKCSSVTVSRLESEVVSIRSLLRTKLLDGGDVALSLPLLRQSLQIYRMPAEQRVAYWRELVSQVGKKPKELELIGIFPSVPEKGIDRVALMAKSGSLRLWLDRQKVRQAKSGTMIVARDRTSGRLYRVFDRRK